MSAEAAGVQALIESNAREAADLAGELMLLLDRAPAEPQCLAAARMVTRRLSDRLGQVVTLERLSRRGAIHADVWSPVELLEELVHEARSLARGGVAVEVHSPDLVPQSWFFDRELVTLALHGALHSALVHAAAAVRLALRMEEGYLGFGIGDDAGAFPAELVAEAEAPPERGECNGNALGIHFARLVATGHVCGGRRGRVQLVNQAGGAGTCFTLWLP